MKTFRALSLGALLAVAGSAIASQSYIIRYTEDNNLSGFLARYSLRLNASIPGQPVYRVSDPYNRPPASVIQRISDDTDDDVSIEVNQTVRLPELSVKTNQTSSAAALEAALANPTYTSYFGATAHSGFARQATSFQVSAPQTWARHGMGSGLVAVVDTGVDAQHPLLKPVVVPGIDLLTPGGVGSELTGLPAGLVAMLNPTTTPLLMRARVHSNPTTTPLLEAPLREYFRVNSIPRALGHGTMVAGAVRLTAPGARILPVRAFSQDGIASLWNVILSIHLAKQRGARVINLSLNTYLHSMELQRTAEYVSSTGTMLVASAGNDGLTGVPSYPASLDWVTGVASVGVSDRRSVFSNAGDKVCILAAPGEALLLPFPGNRYAGGWGTSFAAPLVAGLAAQINRFKPTATYSDLHSAVGKSTQLSDVNLGLGRLNTVESVAAFR